MIYIIAKTKKSFSLHSFKDYEEFIEWLHNCVLSFGEVRINNVEVDNK